MCGPLAMWIGVQLACKEQDIHNLFLFHLKVIHVYHAQHVCVESHRAPR